MVERLLASGHRVTVYRRGAGLSEVMAAGAEECSGYAALAARSHVLVTCLYNDDQVRSVLIDEGMLAALPPGSILVNHTTGSPHLARELAKVAPEGVSVLDATFSGGPHDVAAGRLTVMVGGPEEQVQRVAPLLQSYAESVHHVGSSGAGQLVKLLNNLLFATNLMNAAELLSAAEQLGFDARKIARILQASSGGSFAAGMFESRHPVSSAMEGARPYLAKDVKTAWRAAGEERLDLGGFERTFAYFCGGERGG